ncbi:MAG: bifunctional ADP-dependent NAD(P)H-hydrate dehydratase/NAD(P)H-hydrate epimerase [Waddliaceae bacterium]|nr:bifunctional ADP-dependent NAD(P)H-hydrate dehydratase/NAD(P)H-hydrate epimerase [Waddliaceae bacterium]
MHIVSAEEMVRIEALAYADGFQEADFMEEAGRGVAELALDVLSNTSNPIKVLLLCGKGNNAGDAYVAGSYILRHNIDVTAHQLVPLEAASPLCRENIHRFTGDGGKVLYENTLLTDDLSQYDLILDGLLGIGARGEIQGLYKTVIEKVNQSEVPVLAIDIPSGINGSTGENLGIAIQAVATVFLGLPKIGFFLRDAWNHTGALHYVFFGLEGKYTQEAVSNIELLDQYHLLPSLPKIIRKRHKYQAGYVLALAGSPGMFGAAILACKAALRSGAGIVRCLLSQGMENESLKAPYELITQSYDRDNLDEVWSETRRASACLIGPGLGRTGLGIELLDEFLNQLSSPVVIDADALTYLALSSDPKFPKNAVLTPHIGEMCRLLGIISVSEVDGAFLQRCQDYAEEYGVTIVLKGGPTFILHPGCRIQVCSRGCPGMATAGSGDVLSGVIAALLAQRMSPRDAAALGVYLHALAGEEASLKYTDYGVMAGDIIDSIAIAIKELVNYGGSGQYTELQN